eukprot:12660371-Heterocapsa_arctica.AAC.1
MPKHEGVLWTRKAQHITSSLFEASNRCPEPRLGAKSAGRRDKSHGDSEDVRNRRFRRGFNTIYTLRLPSR